VHPFHMESITAGGHCAVLRIDGDIDAYAAPQLRHRVTDLAAHGTVHIGAGRAARPGRTVHERLGRAPASAIQAARHGRPVGVARNLSYGLTATIHLQLGRVRFSRHAGRRHRQTTQELIICARKAAL